MEGEAWENQVKSLRTILTELSSNPHNHVSIIVFASDVTVICENHEASSINVNTIKFPGGNTNTPAAFGAANTIMSNYVEEMNLYFTYISDGEGPHPHAEI
jgi:uncharacterized protein YegL